MSKPLRILLVEDDADDALLFQRRCPPTFRVQHVTQADAAMAVLRNQGCDLCFTDYRLGASTGLELVRRARAERLRVPLVVVTGQDVESLGENALLAGATDFVPKDDLSTATLERVARWALIRRHVENRREDAVGEEALTRLMGRAPRVAAEPPAPASPAARRVIYLSRALRSFSGAELLTLCSAFSAANARLHVTGALLHVGNRFLQVIEGEQVVIEVLLRRIESDPRHGDLSVLIDEPINARAFAQWNMGCVNLNEQYELSSTQLAKLRTQASRLLEEVNAPREGIRELIRGLPALLQRLGPSQSA